MVDLSFGTDVEINGKRVSAEAIGADLEVKSESVRNGASGPALPTGAEKPFASAGFVLSSGLSTAFPANASGSIAKAGP